MNAFFALLVTAALVGHGEARGHALCVQPVDSNARWFGQGGLDFDMASPPLKCGRRATATSVTTTITTVTTTVATTVSTTIAATTTTTVTTIVTTTTTACPKCSAYAGFIGGACAETRMIDAGSTVVCENAAIKSVSNTQSGAATSNPLSACMALSFSLMCPGSWAGNTLPILKSAKAVKCMTCSAPTIGTDQNPAAGEYFVNIKWGRNVHNDGQKVQFAEWVLEGYNVVIVDKNMRILQKVASVPKDGKSSTCCDMAYSKTVQGTWPEGGAKFMVVPYSTGIGAQNYAYMPSTFMLPMGQTGDFTDVKTGRTTVVKGSIGFDVPDVNYIKQHQMGVVMQEAIAKTLDGIEPENVAIIKITLSSRLRRLGADFMRRLSRGQVKVEYTIITPKSYSGPTIDKATIQSKSSQMATEIKNTAKSLGIETEVVSIVPSAVLVTLIDATTTTTTTTTTSTTTTMTTTTTTKRQGVAASGSVTSTAVASVFIAIFAAIERKLLA